MNFLIQTSSQREIKEHAESFARALRAALREDPDIVMVGEMRDLETTEIAIETAETGHLVLGTLHTSTAATTIDRIIDQFPHDQQDQVRTMLAASLKSVICQTLCKRADGNGRVAALEIMVVTHGVAANIRNGKTHQIPTAIQTGKRLGMQLINDDLVRLVKEHVVDAEEAYLKAIDKNDMANKLRTAGFRIEAAPYRTLSIFGNGSSQPKNANPTVPMIPKMNAVIRFVCGLTCHKKAPPRAATATKTSRIR